MNEIELARNEIVDAACLWATTINALIENPKPTFQQMEYSNAVSDMLLEAVEKLQKARKE